jgi:putative PEP-CTERM system TPR-repeat lipoprotein
MLETFMRRFLDFWTPVWLICLTAAACGGSNGAAENIAKGDEFLKQGKTAEALIEYQSAVQEDAMSGEARQKLGRTLMTAGQPEAALGQLVRAADLLPQDVTAQLEAGRLLLAAGRFDDARDRAERVLQIDSRNALAHVLRSGASAGLKDNQGALDALNESLKFDPNRSSTYIDRARLQAAEGQRAEAEAGFKQAIVVAPQSLQAHMALANYYFVTGRAPDAIAALKKASEAIPNAVEPYVTLASVYRVLGRPAEAEEPLKHVARLSSEPANKLTLADLYVSLRRYQDAKPILTELANIKEAAIPAKGRLAGIEYEEGRRDRAHEMVDALIKENPDSVAVLTVKGNWLLGEGRREEALAVARRAVQAEPRAPEAHFLEGQAQVALNDAVAAEKAFQEVLKLRPTAVDALVALAHLNLDTGRVDAAALFAQQAIDARSDVASRFAMARVLVAQGRVPQARAELETLAGIAPGQADIMNLQGQFLQKEGNLEGARKAFSAALKAAPSSAVALRGLLELDIQAKRPGDSKQRIEAHLKQFPQDARALVIAGRTYAAVGDLAAAESALRKAIDLDPTQLEGYHVLGQILVRQKKLDQALKAYEERVAERPDDVSGHTMIGMIQLVQGNMAAARERFEKVLSLDPRSSVASNNLAYMDAEAGTNLDVALNRAQQAKASQPDDANVSDTLGWVYVKRGLPALAVSPLEQATQKEPGNPTYHYHLGIAYVKAGDRDRGRVSLQRALQISKSFAGADDAQRTLDGLGR